MEDPDFLVIQISGKISYNFLEFWLLCGSYYNSSGEHVSFIQLGGGWRKIWLRKNWRTSEWVTKKLTKEEEEFIEVLRDLCYKLKYVKLIDHNLSRIKRLHYNTTFTHSAHTHSRTYSLTLLLIPPSLPPWPAATSSCPPDARSSWPSRRMSREMSQRNAECIHGFNFSLPG